jgi:hypothetical protein
MKKTFIYIGITAMLVIAGCNKSTGPKLIFEGVTEMDKFGAVVGKADSTDWRTDEVWTEKEKQLFKTTYNEKGTSATKLKVMFYPNPCRGKSVLFLTKDSTTKLALRIVDKDFNVVMSSDSITDKALQLDLSSLAQYDTVRMYYKLIDAQKNEFKGHGDVVLKLK